jgi:hypothetical protein
VVLGQIMRHDELPGLVDVVFGLSAGRRGDVSLPWDERMTHGC